MVRTFGGTVVAALLVASGLASARAGELSDTSVAATQNSVLNMFISALPTMANVELQQVGRTNGVWVYQAVPASEIGVTTQDNSLLLDQNGKRNNLFMLQVGRTNFAIVTQHNERPKTIFFGTDYEARNIASGAYLRFRSGDIDLISITPKGLTAGPSSFGRAH